MIKLNCKQHKNDQIQTCEEIVIVKNVGMITCAQVNYNMTWLKDLMQVGTNYSKSW
jgi:hypothetical protein